MQSAAKTYKPFWLTAVAALQHATLAALGRIFDPEVKANHSVTRLFVTIMKDRAPFSRASLAARKANVLSGTALAQYLDQAFYPTIADLQALKTEVGVWRTYFEQVLRELRHRVVAHRDAGDDAQIAELWSLTDVRELEQLLINLRHLHQSLHDLYFNGRQPLPTHERSSALAMLAMLAQPSERVGGRPLPEICAKAAADVIDVLAEQLANVPMTREDRAIDRQRMYARAQLEFDQALQQGQDPARGQ